MILRWRPSESFAALEVAGETFRIDFDLRARTTRYSNGAEDAFASHSDDIAVVAEAVTELKRRDVFDRLVRSVRELEAAPLYSECINCEIPSYDLYKDTPTDPINGLSGGPGCNGPQVRGEAFGEMAKSIICAEARNDANVKCWNRLCVGCCELRECDAFCVLGDYLCLVAGVTGRSCG